MALINTRILSSNLEVIRDQVGAILALELENQKSFGDTDLTPLKVWNSRSIPFSHTEMPAVNVNFASGNHQSQDYTADTRVYKYSIDIHAGSKTTPSERGDTKAMIIMQKVMGISMAILMHNSYKTLGIPAPSVQTKWIDPIDVADVLRNDAESLIFGRFILNVRINENRELLVAPLLGGIDTRIKLHETEEGFYFRVNGY